MKIDSRAWIALVVVSVFVFFVFKMFENQEQQKDSETDQSSTEKPNENKKESRTISSLPPAPQSPSLNIDQAPITQTVATATPSPVIHELARVLKEKTGLPSWKVDAGTSQSFSITGEIFKFPMGAIVDRLQWGRFLAEQVGIRAEQIVDVGSTQPDSSFSKSYELNQSYQGYLVEGSFIRIHQRIEDGYVFFSSMNLQEIGHPDLEIKVGITEAQAMVTNRYPPGTTVRILKTTKDPFIYVTRPGQSELAWHIDIKLSGTISDSRELLVSAKTGSVLREVFTRVF